MIFIVEKKREMPKRVCPRVFARRSSLSVGALNTGIRARRAALAEGGRMVAAAAVPPDIPKQMMWAGDNPTAAASSQAAETQVLPGVKQVHSFVDPSPWCGRRANASRIA